MTMMARCEESTGYVTYFSKSVTIAIISASAVETKMLARFSNGKSLSINEVDYWFPLFRDFEYSLSTAGRTAVCLATCNAIAVADPTNWGHDQLNILRWYMSQVTGSYADKKFVTADLTYWSCVTAAYSKLLFGGVNVDTQFVVNTTLALPDRPLPVFIAQEPLDFFNDLN